MLQDLGDREALKAARHAERNPFSAQDSGHAKRESRSIVRCNRLIERVPELAPFVDRLAQAHLSDPDRSTAMRAILAEKLPAHELDNVAELLTAGVFLTAPASANRGMDVLCPAVAILNERLRTANPRSDQSHEALLAIAEATYFEMEPAKGKGEPAQFWLPVFRDLVDAERVEVFLSEVFPPVAELVSRWAAWATTSAAARRAAEAAKLDEERAELALLEKWAAPWRQKLDSLGWTLEDLVGPFNEVREHFYTGQVPLRHSMLKAKRLLGLRQKFSALDAEAATKQRAAEPGPVPAPPTKDKGSKDRAAAAS